MRLSVVQAFHGTEFRLESSDYDSLLLCAREVLSMTNQMMDDVECDAKSGRGVKDIQYALCHIKRNLDMSPR